MDMHMPNSLPMPMQPKHPGQFSFPHFSVLGYSKCATTSLY